MTKAHQPKRTSLLRGSLIFSSLTLVSRVMGLVRDLFITAKLGASATIAADAFYTALSFPNIFRRIFAEGAFTAAFVPAYAKMLSQDGERSADALASDAMAALASATIVLTVIAQLAMPWLMFAINPGYANDPDKFRLCIILTQITMPYLPCMAIVALLSGVLNARHRFALSAVAPTVLNAFMLAAVIPAKTPHDAAYAASFAVIGAGIVQAGLLWWGARRVGARIVLKIPRLTPEIRKLIGLALPGAFAASATQINIFVSGILASHVTGARSWLNVADRFYQLPLGLVGVAIGVALLPRLSHALAANDQQDAQNATDQAIVFGMALTLPAVAAMVAAPFYLVDGLFTRGAFTAFDAHQTSLALLNYGWGTPAFVLNRILAPVFFARENTKGPMRFALISVALNIGLGLALFNIIGFAGIAAATSIAAWVNIAQMVHALRKRGDYSPSAYAWGKLGRVLFASVILGVLLALATYFRPQIEAPLAGVHLFGFGPKEISVIALAILSMALYPVLLFATGGVTPTEAKAALRRRKGTDPVPPPEV